MLIQPFCPAEENGIPIYKNPKWQHPLQEEAMGAKELSWRRPREPKSYNDNTLWRRLREPRSCHDSIPFRKPREPMICHDSTLWRRPREPRSCHGSTPWRRPGEPSDDVELWIMEI